MTVHKETLIAQRAYEIWEQSGRPHGRDREHWLQATAEIEQATAKVNGDAPIHASPGTVVSGDAPVRTSPGPVRVSPSRVISGDAPVHGPAVAAATPHKVATTAPAKTKAAPKA